MLKSSRKPIYSVQSFSKARGGFAVDTPLMATGERQALRMAERLGEERAGAIAFYRVGDPEVGEFDDPVVIARFGEMPNHLLPALGL